MQHVVEIKQFKPTGAHALLSLGAAALVIGATFALDDSAAAPKVVAGEIPELSAMTFFEASDLCEDVEAASGLTSASYRIASDGKFMYCKDGMGGTLWKAPIFRHWWQ